MLGLKIVCWAYLILIFLERLVKYDKVDASKGKCIDNVMFIALVVLIYFLSK